MPKYLTADVPADALLIDDVIVTDPDHPGTEVHWQVTAKDREAGVLVIEYVTEDGTEGRHGFIDRKQRVTVQVRQHKGAA